MKPVSNIVLYAGDNPKSLRVLTSVSDSDKYAAMKLSHAASEEFRKCDRAGVAYSALKCVKETRSADEAGKLEKVSYAELDVMTLKHRVEGGERATLDSLYAEDAADAAPAAPVSKSTARRK